MSDLSTTHDAIRDAGYGVVAMAAAEHEPVPNAGHCSCGFCAYSTEHVALMAFLEAVPHIAKAVVDLLAAEHRKAQDEIRCGGYHPTVPGCVLTTSFTATPFEAEAVFEDDD